MTGAMPETSCIEGQATQPRPGVPRTKGLPRLSGSRLRSAAPRWRAGADAGQVFDIVRASNISHASFARPSFKLAVLAEPHASRAQGENRRDLSENATSVIRRRQVIGLNPRVRGSCGTAQPHSATGGAARPRSVQRPRRDLATPFQHPWRAHARLSGPKPGARVSRGGVTRTPPLRICRRPRPCDAHRVLKARKAPPKFRPKRKKRLRRAVGPPAWPEHVLIRPDVRDKRAAVA
jgi:hypothetical protein